MMRKKLVSALIVTLLVLPLNVPLVLADTATTTTTSTSTTNNISSTSAPLEPSPILDVNGKPISPGTLPDSPFYWLSNIIEKIQLVFTFDPAQKTALVQHRALEKLAAAQEMAIKGKPDLAEKAFAEYSEKVNEVQIYLGQLKDANTGSAQQLQTGLAKTYAANIQVISELLDKLPAKTVSKLADNVVRSMEKTVAKMDQADKKQVESVLQKDSQKLKGKLDEQANTAFADLQKSLGTTESESESEKASLPNGNTNQGISVGAGNTNNTQGEGGVKKAEIAKEREKGQQGDKEREEYQNALNAKNDSKVQDANKEQEQEQDSNKEQKDSNVQQPTVQPVAQPAVQPVAQPIAQPAQVTAPSAPPAGQKATKGGEGKNKKGHENNSEVDD
ncbi:MAG: DUF5667 domain-containing protein [Desulfitobacteriaceae bacterium]